MGSIRRKKREGLPGTLQDQKGLSLNKNDLEEQEKCVCLGEENKSLHFDGGSFVEQQ